MKTMTYEEALDTCNYKITNIASIYGRHWKEEEPFLKTCRDALEYVLHDLDEEETEEES